MQFLGKLNGAVGNFNSHYYTYPEYDWSDLSKKFINCINLILSTWT